MLGEPYSIIEVQPGWVLEPEAMGSKTKFWYRSDDGKDWLFKYPQPNTGQHWAEKIAAEIAAGLPVLHAKVELATFQGIAGSSTESFIRSDRQLFHGNQILAGLVTGYSRDAKFGHSAHTWANICLAMDRLSKDPHSARSGKQRLAEYLVLDACIGNTDRHHENWGLLLKRLGSNWRGGVAPTFDHASALGRELLDERRERLLQERRVGQYVEKGSGAIFWDESQKRGSSPLELVRKASAAEPELWHPALEKVRQLEWSKLEEIVGRVPADWMSPPARAFALAIMRYSIEELRRLPV